VGDSHLHDKQPPDEGGNMKAKQYGMAIATAVCLLGWAIILLVDLLGG
jgi:hypothetical protein